LNRGARARMAMSSSSAMRRLFATPYGISL
jgi:hypothetical protein